MLGNFKREGKALSNGPLKSLDHDFSTFSDGQIVPHGIYDVTRNVGYMTLGISHDTSKFVCDNIARVWREYLKEQYPDARTLVILCDGGGSNSSSHRIVKQDLMDLAKVGVASSSLVFRSKKPKDAFQTIWEASLCFGGVSKET